MMYAWIGLALAIDPVVEPVGEGTINWTTLELLAGARGRPTSGAMLNLETLEDDARGRLGPTMLELARKVRVDSTRTVGDLLAADDEIAVRIDDNLSLWEVYEVRYFTSGSVEIEGALPLQGLLRPALVRAAGGKERESPPTGSTSGLVVDARGLAVSPAVAPRILGPDGVLYGLEVLTEASASSRSPVVYVTDPADVAASRRAGAQPVFVRAAEVVDGTDLRLGAEDAARVVEKASAAPFLLHGNVVIVVGPAAPAVPAEAPKTGG